MVGHFSEVYIIVVGRIFIPTALDGLQAQCNPI